METRGWGDALLDPLVTRRVIASFAAGAQPFTAGPAPGVDQLTARGVEVLHALSRGLSNAEALVVGRDGQDPRGQGAHEARAA